MIVICFSANATFNIFFLSKSWCLKYLASRKNICLLINFSRENSSGLSIQWLESIQSGNSFYKHLANITRHRCGCMWVKQMDGYSFWINRLWVWLLVTETVAIEASTRSPRVLATSKGPTVSSPQEEAEKLGRKVTAAMKKTRVRRLRVWIPVPEKFSLK